jgi:hypothetical protein
VELTTNAQAFSPESIGERLCLPLVVEKATWELPECRSGFVYLVFSVGFSVFSLTVFKGRIGGAKHLSQPPRGGLSSGLIRRLCGFFHKLFTGSAPSSGAGTEAKIIPVLNKEKGVLKRMNSFVSG